MTVPFYSKSDKYSALSNLSGHPIELDNLRWPTVEHYYQAQKYAGTPVADRIRKAHSPKAAMKLGQNRSYEVRADWGDVKEDVMRRAVEAKFDQNRVAKELLLSTGDEELVHRSNADTFWGDGADGSGENKLGRILMEVRSTLRDKCD